MRMVNNRILVECQDEDSQQTTSGLYLAVDSSQEQVKQGKVVAVGPGRPVEIKLDFESDYYGGYVCPPIYHAMPVKEGDQVLYPQGGGLRYRDGGKNYILLTDYEILAVL